MNILYKSLQMPKEFMDAVETIMKYCQNEDCDEDCKKCPCSLAEIRCGDTEEESGYVKREHVVEIIDEQIVKYNYKTNRLEVTERERNSIDRLTKS